MKIVLFGAGASFGAGEIDPCPPPLGKDLYNVLAQLFPITWGSIPDDTKDVFRENFELGMQHLIDRHGYAIAPLMQHMAIFFSRFGILENGENLYVRFFKALEEQRLHSQTIVSTLNYECLCERGASLAGLPVHYFGIPNHDAPFAAVWKLHGSCNFKLAGIDATRGVSFSGVNIAFEGGIEAVNPPDVARIYRGNTSLYPSMSLYAKNKPVSMAPSILQEKQALWATEARTAETIAVIGVRPNPDDSHIWQPISECGGKFCFIGNQTDFNEWTAHYRRGKINRYINRNWASGFDECIAHLT